MGPWSFLSPLGPRLSIGVDAECNFRGPVEDVSGQLLAGEDLWATAACCRHTPPS